MTDYRVDWNVNYSFDFIGDDTDTSCSVPYQYRNKDTSAVLSSGTKNASWNGSKWETTFTAIPNVAPSGVEVLYDIESDLEVSLTPVTGTISGSFEVAFDAGGGSPTGSGTESDPFIITEFGAYTFNFSDNESGFMCIECQVPIGIGTGVPMAVQVTNDFGAGLDTVMYGDVNGVFDVTNASSTLAYCNDDFSGNLLSRLDNNDWGNNDEGDTFQIQIAEYDTGCGQDGNITSSDNIEVSFLNLNDTQNWDSGSGTESDPYVATALGTYEFNTSVNDNGFICCEFTVPSGVSDQLQVEITDDGGSGFDTIMYGDTNVGFDVTNAPATFAYCDDDGGSGVLSLLNSSAWGFLGSGEVINIQVAEYNTGCGQDGFVVTNGTLKITFSEE